MRRSPSNQYCYFITLPLDLHVLSLPLAFILSQDQTLHCKNLFNVLLESWLFQSFLKGNWQINTTLFSQYRKPVNQRTIFLNLTTPNFRSGKWCKGKTFFCNHQIFLKLFLKNFSTIGFYHLLNPLQNRCNRCYFLIAGAKIETKKLLCKCFANFFTHFVQIF